MSSLFDELTEKLRKDPRLTKRGGPRADLGLLMFNARDDVRALWHAAVAELERAKHEQRAVPEALATAVEALRPIFGDRP